MNENNQVEMSMRDGICVASFSGHLSFELSDKLLPLIDQKLEEGARSFLFDYSGVSMLDSPAIAAMLRSAEKIVDDNEGCLAFSGLNEVCSKVLEMVGVFLYANRFDSLETALKEVKA